MKRLIAATLLVAVIAVTGCSEKKTTTPTTKNPPANTSAPADKTMPAPAGETKAP